MNFHMLQEVLWRIDYLSAIARVTLFTYREYAYTTLKNSICWFGLAFRGLYYLYPWLRRATRHLILNVLV